MFKIIDKIYWVRVYKGLNKSMFETQDYRYIFGNSAPTNAKIIVEDIDIAGRHTFKFLSNLRSDVDTTSARNLSISGPLTHTQRTNIVTSFFNRIEQLERQRKKRRKITKVKRKNTKSQKSK